MSSSRIEQHQPEDTKRGCWGKSSVVANLSSTSEVLVLVSAPSTTEKKKTRMLKQTFAYVSKSKVNPMEHLI